MSGKASVTAMPGCSVPTSEPNQALVAALRDLLSRAESGHLQSFVGTGFMADGLRMGFWCDLHPNIYEQLGSIEWLKAEYMHRHSETGLSR